MLMNKNFKRKNISSIELNTPINQNVIINENNKKILYEEKSLIKENKSLKNNEIINFPKVKSLIKTPEKEKKDNYRAIKENYSADQKKEINIHNLSKNLDFDDKSKIIKLSNIYKLPVILRNEYTSLRRPQKTDIKKEEAIKQNLNIIPSLKITKTNNNKFYEIQRAVNKDLKKNVNINIIDYNKILFKKDSKPIKILDKALYKDTKNLRNYKKSKLQNYIKDRFYADTESRMNKKLKDIVFNHDHSLKDKIIEMNQIGNFWGGIVDYCNPVFSMKRFGYLKQKLNKNKINKKIKSNDVKVASLSGSKKNIKIEVKKMKLFTIDSYFDYKHKKKMETKKEFFERNNNSLQYYVI